MSSWKLWTHVRSLNETISQKDEDQRSDDKDLSEYVTWRGLHGNMVHMTIHVSLSTIRRFHIELGLKDPLEGKRLFSKPSRRNKGSPLFIVFVETHVLPQSESLQSIGRMLFVRNIRGEGGTSRISVDTAERCCGKSWVPKRSDICNFFKIRWCFSNVGCRLLSRGNKITRAMGFRLLEKICLGGQSSSTSIAKKLLGSTFTPLAQPEGS